MSSNRFGKSKSHLKELLFSDAYGLSMASNSFLFEQTEDILQNLIAGGIPHHLFNYYISYLNRRQAPILSGPKVLNIDDLSYGFIIWLVACSFAVLMFILEVFVTFLLKLWRKLKNLFALYFFTKFLLKLKF